MFDIKYRIEFKNDFATELFGEEYYCDKSTFWNHHQTMLKELYRKVLISELPIKITEIGTKSELIINEVREFEIWIETNQPFIISTEY
jgi:hypothetical protein